MFILWVAYQIEVALVPWHDPNVMQNRANFVFFGALKFF